MMNLQINTALNDKTVKIGDNGFATPPIDENYWMFRVQVSDKQAVVGFPKFFTIGIGFQYEEDWNTNLPYTRPAEEIYEHIAHNKGDESISKESCVEAIRIISEAAGKYMEIVKKEPPK